MPGREQGARPFLPGGPPARGPDGRVQALLAERPLDHGQGRAGPAVGVGCGDHPGGPAEQPRLDLGGDEERDRPGPVGREVGRGPVGDPARKLDGEVDGIQGAHRGVLWVAIPALEGPCGSPEERRAECGTRGPARAGGSPQREGAGRRARGHAQDPFSLGVRRGSRSREPWVAFRCGMAGARVPFPAAPVKRDPPRRAPLSDRNHPVVLWLPDHPGCFGGFDYGFATFGCLRPLSTALPASDKRLARPGRRRLPFLPVVRERSTTA